MYTIRAEFNGRFRYYKCENIADAEALLQVFAIAKVPANFL